MRSWLLGKKKGDGERSFRQDLMFLRTDVTCDHIVFSKGITENSTFQCDKGRVEK